MGLAKKEIIQVAVLLFGCLLSELNYTLLAPALPVIMVDMAIYTTCKNNTFNGMPLPDIHILHPDATTTLVARFGYQDFKYRLGSS